MGVLGGICIFIVYFLLLGRIMKIGKESYTNRGAMICYAVAFYIFLHILINLGGILGLMPMTGVPLPFMSYGGSFAMCMIIALTFVQRIHIETRFQIEKSKNQSKKSKK